ncbi:MAG: pentapeptide repeat-containing protein [Thermodesulfobacteriota bacterium]
MKIYLAILSLLFLVTGCATRMNVDDAREQGAIPLDTAAIKTLVSGNTLFMESWDKADKAEVEFTSNSKLTATNVLGGSAPGRWRAVDDQLCLEFRWWGNESGLDCFGVYKLADRFLLFRSDGSLEDSFVPQLSVDISPATEDAGVMAAMPEEWSASSDEKKGEKAAPTKVYSAPIADSAKISSHQQLLLNSGECPGCDLAGLDLSGADLGGAKLAGADLSGAKLSKANLKGADLRGANLAGAQLNDANLSKADLQQAKLDGADLHWADLSKADLRKASLKKAYIIKTVFYKADLTGADLSDVVSQRTIFTKAKGVPAKLLEKNAPWQDK